MSEGYLRIANGAIRKEEGFTILQGWIDPDTLDALLIDDYQRDLLPISTIDQILEGFRKEDGSVPAIDLGMRGCQYHSREGAFILRDPVYIVDGLQRVTAAKKHKAAGGKVILSAEIRFNSTKEQEIERFRFLNGNRTKVSPNVLLHNAQWKHPGMSMLYSMCNEDSQFALKNLVCWKQRQLRNHITYAMVMCRALGHLHTFLVSGSGSVARVDDVIKMIDKLFEKVGASQLRDNARTFYDLVDHCWGLRNITFREKAPHIRYAFQFALARVFDNHEVFWEDKKLVIPRDLRSKLKQFNVYDPSVSSLAGGSGQAARSLYVMLAEHINKGKRTRRLTERRTVITQFEEPIEEPETPNGTDDQPTVT